nr:unnamed protein product [Callosobruchus analis]
MNTGNLKIVQWNARSLQSNKHSLLQIFNEEHFDIAIVYETWYKRSHDVRFRNFSVVKKDRADGYGGVALFISNKLKYEIINFNANFNRKIEVCGINILLNNKKLSVISLYRPPRVKATVLDYINLFNQIPYDCIIGGDFNAHHSVWGSPTCSTDGNILVDAIEEFHTLAISNDGSATRISPPGQQKSVVDITLMTTNLALSSHWAVMTDTYGSDHFPILITFNTIKTDDSLITPVSKWSMTNVKWDVYSAELESYLADTPIFQSANDMAQFLITSISNAANKSCKLLRPFSARVRSPQWWDEECLQAVNARRDSLRSYRNNLTCSNFLEYKRKQAICKRTFQTKAKNSWAQFCTSLNRQTNPSTIWNRVRSISNPKRYPPQDQIQIEALLHKIAPDYAPEATISAPVRSTETHFLLTPIKINELKANIKNSPKSAPGPDGISYKMLANLPDLALEFLCRIYNAILLEGDSCDILKESLIIPVPKPNDPNTMRPIALMSCLLKTFERIIKTRIEWWLESKNTFPESQFGFRRGKGTIDCISHLTTDIQITFSKNQYLASLFVDISSAYDNVILSLLFNKLVNIGIPNHFACVLVNLFTNRQVSIRCNNITLGPRRVNKGLPQGSVLSPLLFNIYTADLHTRDNHSQTLQYADDFCFYLIESTYQGCVERLESVMSSCKSYFLEQGLDISPAKSAVSFFTRHRLPDINNITLGSLNIPVKNCVTYLGITLDSKLTWNDHINKSLDKCERSLNVLKAVNRYKWGADPKTNLLFYRAYTRSIIDYGCFLYGSATQSRLLKIDRIQFKALRLALGALRSTPTQALLAECNEPPLYLRRLFLAEKYIIKCKFNNQGEIIRKVSELAVYNLTNTWWQNKNSPTLADAFTNITSYNIKGSNIPFYSSKFEISFQKPSVIIPTFNHPNTNTMVLQDLLSSFNNPCVIYTDGSKSDAGVGAAVYVHNNGISIKYKMNPVCSIFTAELTAIELALDWASKTTQYKQYAILSDSLSSILALSQPTNHIFSNRIMTNLLEKELLLNQQNKSVTYVWVKGHSCIKGNEIVDRLAKDAAITGCNIDNITRRDIISTRKTHMRDQWEDQWRQFCRNSNTAYSKIHPSLPTTKLDERSHPNRKLNTLYIRCLFGHANINSYRLRMGLSETDTCDCNGDTDDLNHWFFNCRYNELATNNMLAALVATNMPLPQNHISLMVLSRVSNTVKSILWDFFKAVKRLI